MEKTSGIEGVTPKGRRSDGWVVEGEK